MLALVWPRLEGNPRPSTAVAFLWGAKARAHEVLGEEPAFRDAVDRSRRLLDAAPVDPAEPSGFQHERLAFYEATGCVKLSDTAGAAADRAIRLYRTSPRRRASEPVMVRLDKASALAQAGEIDEACQVATAALTDEHTVPSASVLIRAAEFDTLLGTDTTPEIHDWREALHTARRNAPGRSSG